MLDRLRSHSFSYQAPVLVCLLAILLLLVLPTGFEGALIYQEAERCTARVLETDNSAIIDTGLVRSGEQRCQLEILDGSFQGRTVTGINMLNGSLEQDKLFSPGDRAQVVVSHDGDTITNVTMSDHYRLGWEALMAAGFALFLILFAGRTGVRAIASFVLTVLCLWKLLVPLYLKGWNPIWVGLAITLFLTILIIALVYGFDQRCWAAVSGSFLGILVTCVLGILFTDLFQIHGAVMSYSESLLYSGYAHLSRQEAARSGLNVGRAAMGTMTTTLLFAYSGGYIALLMVFMAQGTPVDHIRNYKYVAAEIIHTVIGSFGLVTVAPFTALCAGLFLARRGGHPQPQKESEG